MRKLMIALSITAMTFAFSTAAFAVEETATAVPVTTSVTDTAAPTGTDTTTPAPTEAPVTEAAATAVQTNIESAMNSDLAIDTGVATSEAKDDKLPVKEEKALKKKFVAEYKVLEGLRAECKALWTTIKTKNAEIKTAWATLKTSIKNKTAAERKAILSDVNSKLTTFREAIKADHASIKAFRAEKKQAWADYRAAIKAKHTVEAKAAMDQILALKGQIVEKQKHIVAQKTEILNVINGAVVK